MCDERFDITYCDLNPTFLYTWKGTRRHTDSYHQHDCVEMAFVLSGAGKYIVDGESILVKAGDVLVFNPGVKHQGIRIETSEPAVEFFVGFADLQFKGMKRDEIELKGGGFVLHTDTELRQKLTQLCFNMTSENASRQPGRYFMLKTYLIQFLLLVIREQIEPLKVQREYEFESFNKTYIVEQIINYFNEHYDEKISLDQIAKNMYLSPFYISKIFKSETGETPINYLIQIRLDKAKDYLESTEDANIKEVATKVGYEDVYHFSKLFKKYFGIAPSHYKKEKSNGQ